MDNDSQKNVLRVIPFLNFYSQIEFLNNLGNYTAGQELCFQIHVLNTNSNWYSGNASLNAVRMAHNMVINDWAPSQTLIGFENLINGGVKDYDDLAFSLMNVQASAVPEPTTLVRTNRFR